jgi:CRISPR-associated endonuclease/helicase Cas3
MYYAHSKENVDKSEWQRLIDHLTRTGDLAFELGRDAGVSELAQVAGRLHDIGKYSQAFQRRLEGAKRPVDHATAGAREIARLFQTEPQKPFAELLSYCIAGHHSGLPDYGDISDVEGDATLLARREKKKLEDYSVYKTEIDTTALTFQPRLIKPIKDHRNFSVSFLARMVYSTLVDADWLETETYMNGGKKPRGEYESIEVLTQRLSLFLRRFDNPQNVINQKRTETLKACLEKSADKQGIFTLTVPTGGGKTLASMAFALNHAVTHGLKRIIYVIPFTSIIEQNAAVFKDCLGEANILEHHSNFDWEGHKQESPDDETNNATEKLKLASENWDIPIVFTTNVQFFESLFASKKSRCRKLHNIAKSVIIFDEAQMLPREYMKPCMLAVQELVQNYGASAVLCTATQPLLKQFMPNMPEFTELAPDPQALFNFYKRVQVKNMGKLPDAELLEQMNTLPQVLCIVNTRKHAKGLFDGLAEEGRFHLSTLMCPAHRKETLVTIRERLKNEGTCRVVSTQVMEAGIDVDFPVGYRALAGLDSIIQAAGRVNREGKRPSGEMFVFEPESEFIKRTPTYIKQTADVARSILRDFGVDPTSMQAISAYFNMLITLQDKRIFDAKEILPCFDKSDGFDFKTAAEKFKLIEDNTVAVIIPYNDKAAKLVEELRYTPYPASTLRKLQGYTVNVYEQEFQALNAKGVIGMAADAYAVLTDTSYYDAQTGIIIPARDGGEAIFFD